jgi:cobalt/nickel transport system permease protein
MKPGTRRTVAALVVVGMLLSTLLATVVSLVASGAPDGLERVAIDQGFDGTAQPSAAESSLLAGYVVDGQEDGLSPSVAGLLGVAITAVVAFGLFAVLKPRGTAGTSAGEAPDRR